MSHLYPSKIPFWVKWIFPRLIYNYPDDNKTVYLSFDDGPTPEVTPWVLDVLKREQVKAVFFCVGHQIEKHPDIFKQIIAAGHRIGNHTYQHENGWQTSTVKYVESLKQTEQIINQYTTSSKYFRPPYGRITPKQIKLLQQADYKIIMWSLLSGDFSSKLDPVQAPAYLKKHTRAGDIVVFHDSRKAFDNLKLILPDYLSYLKKQGFRFSVL